MKWTNILYRVLSGIVGIIFTTAVIICVIIMFNKDEWINDTLLLFTIIFLTCSGFIGLIEISVFSWWQVFKREEK